MNKKISSLLLCVILLLPLSRQAVSARPLPDCVKSAYAGLVFPGDRSAQDRFYAKMDSLVASARGNVNIWHIGGSHVQAAFFPNRVMNNIDSVTVRGDRGFLFPRRLCRTNSDKSYRISTTGAWQAPMMTSASSKVERPRYGITGFGARTSDPTSSVSFNLNPSGDSLWAFRRLSVLGYASSPEVRPFLVVAGDTLTCRFEAEKSTYVFDLQHEADSAVLYFDMPSGSSFVLNGLYPSRCSDGVNYFSSGVNGAKTTSWLDRCEDLERDLGLVCPDLAIFALGINDSACTADRFDPERFKSNYRRLIEMLRRVSPDCAIIFITNNDSYRYIRRGMTYNENAPAVRLAMMQLAQEYGAGVWDLYGIMGGRHSADRWKDEGLMKPDRLHFTDEGYTLLGDLFFEALKEDHDTRN